MDTNDFVNRANVDYIKPARLDEEIRGEESNVTRANHRNRQLGFGQTDCLVGE